MASKDNRTGDRHQRDPVAYRPPKDLWPLLDAIKEREGLGVSAILSKALREYLTKTEPESRENQ